MKKSEDQRRRKVSTKSESKDETSKTDDNSPAPPRYGPMPSFPYQRVWARVVLILGVLTLVYYSTKKENVVSFVKQTEVVQQRIQEMDCSQGYLKEIEQFPLCMPEKCGRVVTDKLVTAAEANMLLQIAKRGFALGESNGGASILDLHSGALSQGKGFVNIYNLESAKNVFQKSDLTVYKIVKMKIQHAIAHHFGFKSDFMYLTHPTFFSQLTSKAAQTVHDEYWHVHVDKQTYESFHYTSLVYLSDYGVDFQGGRFVFVEEDGKNRTVEPRKGRVSMFTSGWENPHYVERVTSGTRYAITVSFTCNKKFAIEDPSFLTGPVKTQ